MLLLAGMLRRGLLFLALLPVGLGCRLPACRLLPDCDDHRIDHVYLFENFLVFLIFSWFLHVMLL